MQIAEAQGVPTRNNVFKQHKTLNDSYKNNQYAGVLAPLTGTKTASNQTSTASQSNPAFNVQKNQFKDKLTP